MSFRHCLPLIIFVGFVYATVFLILKVFLGHYGIVPGALLAVLLVGTPFIPFDWIVSLLALQDRLLGELEEILRGVEEL